MCVLVDEIHHLYQPLCTMAPRKSFKHILRYNTSTKLHVALLLSLSLSLSLCLIVSTRIWLARSLTQSFLPMRHSSPPLYPTPHRHRMIPKRIVCRYVPISRLCSSSSCPVPTRLPSYPHPGPCRHHPPHPSSSYPSRHIMPRTRRQVQTARLDSHRSTRDDRRIPKASVLPSSLLQLTPMAADPHVECTMSEGLNNVGS